MDWREIEDACGLSFSAEARRRIVWAQGNYHMMSNWPSLTRSKFLDAAAVKEGAIFRFRKDIGDLSGAFGAAIRAALVTSRRSETGVEWDEADKALACALDRVEILLRHASDAPKEAERWDRATSWDRYVAAIIEAFEHDGHPITVNHAPESQLVMFLRLVGLNEQKADLSSFARRVHRAAKAARSNQTT